MHPCRVTKQGSRLVRWAVVKSVQNYRAGDLLEIDPGEGHPTWMLPFTREAVPEVRLAERRLVAVRPIETE